MGSPVALAFLEHLHTDNVVNGDPSWPVCAAEKLRVVDVPGKGRGVVASRDLRAGELIEVAPVIVLGAAGKAALSTTILDHYGYDWFADGTGLAVALGYGSLYNHSFAPNAIYKKSFNNSTIEYRALIDVAAHVEICINYNGDPNDRTPLWFDVVA